MICKKKFIIVKTGYKIFNNITKNTLRQGFNCSLNTRFLFYKNTLYKNVHDENGQKIKNIVRILPS